MQQFLLSEQAAGGIAPDFLITIVMMVAVFYFILIRPQKKREKEAAQMRSAVEVGDEIVTGGGIIGRVVTVREDSLLIESGSSNTKLRIARWAVQSNNTAQEAARTRVQEAAKARALEKEKAKEAKADKKKDKDMD